MPGIFVGLEHDAAVEEGIEGADLIVFVIPGVGVDFDGPAPFGFPFLVHVDDHVQAAVEFLGFVVVEVDVGVEFLAVAIVVGAAAVEFGVHEEIGNAGEAAHEIEERLRADHFVQFFVGGADLADLGVDGFAA